MPAPAALVQLFEPWAHLYSDSKVLPTVVVYAHIASLLFSGGLAVTIDRGTLRALRADDDERHRHLEDLSAAHRIVVAGLALSAITGLMLFTADLETYFVSPIFWTKAALIGVLLWNGYSMVRTERRIRAASDDAGALWKRLRTAAIVSLLLWFAIPLLGVALVNLG
ncbi:MAG TPA: hypothetical protein VFT29_16735 [Gemmatimonadaceae bacterium]|nr:hypothetical protein [Gemmatimonadaceae bacterium]